MMLRQSSIEFRMSSCVAALSLMAFRMRSALSCASLRESPSGYWTPVGMPIPSPPFLLSMNRPAESSFDVFNTAVGTSLLSA